MYTYIYVEIKIHVLPGADACPEPQRRYLAAGRNMVNTNTVMTLHVYYFCIGPADLAFILAFLAIILAFWAFILVWAFISAFGSSFWPFGPSGP